MRTTLSIADPILEQAKALAQRRGQTLGQVFEHAMRSELLAEPRPSGQVKLPTAGRGGPLPGVDLSSNRSMLQAADGSGMPVVSY